MNEDEFLKSLVRTPSPSGHEQQVAKLCKKYLSQFGFEKTWIDSSGNAVATNYAHSKSSKPDLLLFGHMDTIVQPLAYRFEDGKVYGRGAVDAKSPLAALLSAAGKQQVPYKLMVAGVVEEEISSSKGINHLLGYSHPKMAINGEPSNTNGVTVAYKGRLLVQCRTHGHTFHAGMRAENPLERTLEYYNVLRHEFSKSSRFESVIINMTHISAGSLEALNVVPDTLDFHMDIRVPPSIQTSEVAHKLRELAPSHLSVNVQESSEGVETSVNHPLCRSMVHAIREQGLVPRYVKKSATADMNVTCQSGIPTIAYGPGDSSLDHTPHEVVSLDDYHQSISILRRTLVNLEKYLG